MSRPDLRDDTLGLILAGGHSRRMGENKSLSLLGGRPLLLHLADRLQPQCAMLVVSDNDAATVGLHRYPVLPDRDPARLGPLAGIEAGLDFVVKRELPMRWVLSAPVDTPFLPLDLVERLRDACDAAGRLAAFARTGGQDHPTVALWHVLLLDALSAALHDEALRRVRLFAARIGAIAVDWRPPSGEADPFFNINTPDDLGRAAEQFASARV